MRLIFLVLTFAIFLQLQSIEVSQALDEIPSEDRRKIEELFDYFGRLGNLGHIVFFEKKPMCLTGIPLSCTNSVIPPFIRKEQGALEFQDRIKECWQTWEQHEHRFSHPNFIFSKEIVEVAGGEYLNLYILNKRTTIRFLEENRDIFSQTLGSKFFAEKFIERLESGEKLLDLLKQDQMLLGMLLGYGQISSQAFREKSHEHLTRVSGRPALNDKIGVATVVFMTDLPDEQEVKDLTCTYADELNQMVPYFQSGTFSTKALEALCSK